MQRNEYELAFQRDGSLRSIYVLDTTAEDWQAVMDVVRNEFSPLTFTYGDEPMPLPSDIHALFTSEFTSVLSFWVAHMQVTCHFSSPTAIEFNIDPREVDSMDQLDELLAFMRRVGHHVDKPVLLTHELCPAEVLVRFVPAHDKIEVTPTETWW